MITSDLAHRASKKIYLADDEKNIREIMTVFLKNEGYDVTAFSDGTSIRQAFDAAIPDLIILDVMMPGEDGLSLCSYFRKKSSIPILIVSAKDTPMDRITGIMLGSDDYLTKPFLPLELTVRVKALFRRAALSSGSRAENLTEERLSCGNLSIVPKHRRILTAETPLKVTPTEYEFLRLLA